MDYIDQASNDNIDKLTFDPDSARDSFIYAKTIALSQRLARQARSGRSNWKNMFLISQCLEYANLDKEHKESAIKHYQEFCELFFDGNPDNKNFATDFNAALKTLQKEVFENTKIVLTTFSNSVDKTLTKFFEPDWIIGNEIRATHEPKLLLPIVHNIKSVKRIIGVGDVQQLTPVVLSLQQSRKDKSMVNEFADALARPFLLRAQLAGYPRNIFTKCFRYTKGLKQLASKLFYQGKVVSGPGTELANWPKLQRVVNFLYQILDMNTEIPRCDLDVHSDVIIREKSIKSWFNLHNILATIKLIQVLVGNRIFTLSEITIISLYRA